MGSAQSNKVFIENKGQWDSRILYNQILPDGNLFLEKDGFTYSLFEKSYIQKLHNDKKTPAPDSIKSHVVKTKFINFNHLVTLKKENESSFYHNYFLGNDKSKWKSKVRSTSRVTYQELYKNIDLSIYTEFGSTKYDFIVKPGATGSAIQIDYSGADEIYLEDEKLIVVNTINNIEEAKPFSYQIIEGKRVEVSCRYVLSGTILSFEFPNGYDKSKELIIDPVVVFSTYSGSTANNFGFTATYDKGENTYAGGIVYGNGVYPATIGAHQTSFNAAASYYVDITISKFNKNGAALIYATYLGGSYSEAPHSLSVNNKNELFVMGTTGSSNYPTSTNAYDRTFSGGVDVRPIYSGINYLQGCDLFVTKFNASGTAILGSTFIGGTGNDGVNTDASLAYNYGDAFRGEITIDSSGNAIVASTTNSTNFPTTTGAPQTTYGGGFSDACLFVLDSNLQNLSWSTYYGGMAQDAGYGVQFDSYENYFMTGGTKSSNLVTSATAYDRSYNGNEDGFITKYNTTSNLLIASTYIGTSGYDQSYLVQVDVNDDIYITGQSLGNYPVSLGVYSNAGSSQLFHKFSNNLDSSYWSTVIGSGRKSIDISPSAFLVNDCGLIYLSGWGGVVNRNYRAFGSNTVGLPITRDAFQSTTDGSDFYLMVLNKDAAALRYGTYYGGAVSHEHADGGTSRFDKKGNIYQAVCAGCGGNSDLPTTAGAWSNTNNSSGCNMGVIKMNIAYIQSIASAPAPFICLPDSVNFINNSSGGNSYKWYFGDGDSSSLFQPIHVYPDTGIYNVRLIVSDSTGCVPPDTGYTVVLAYKPKALSIDTVPVICRGDSVQLNAYSGQSYKWTPSVLLSNDSISNPIAFPYTTTTYKLVSEYYCNIDSVYLTVIIDTNTVTVSPDITLCEGSSATLTATGGLIYSWYPTLGMVNGTTSTPTVTPLSSMYYYVDVTSAFGCTYTDSVYVDFYSDSMTISNDTIICVDQSLTLIGTGGGTYVWNNSKTTSSIIETASATTTYTLDVVSPNGCLFRDSVTVTIFNDSMTISTDTGICLGESITVSAIGGGSYVWNNSKTTSSITETPSQTTTYSVIVTSSNGCILRDTTEVFVNLDTVTVSPDITLCEGSSATLTATGGLIYSWYPTLGMVNGTTSTPTVTPLSSMYYYVDVTSAFGCTYTDSVYVDFYSDSMTISNDTIICVDQSLTLIGTGGGTYVWNNSKTTSSIIETASATTTYTLDVVSPNGCLFRDSVTVTIFNDSMTISTDTGICLGSSLNLFSTGGGTYNWDSDPTLVGNTISNPIVTPLFTTNYKLTVVSANGCVVKDSVTILSHDENYGTGPNSAICQGDTALISAYGGVSYSWSPSSTLSSPMSSQSKAFPSQTTVYDVSLITPKGCLKTDSVSIFIDTNIIHPTITKDTVLCSNSPLLLSATGGNSYSWSPAIYLSTPNSPSTLASPVRNTTFYVDISNKCFTVRDSVEVVIVGNNSIVIPDKIICPGTTTNILASGALQYQWEFDNSIISGINRSVLTVQPKEPTFYKIVTVDVYGCIDSTTVFVDLYENPTIEAGRDQIIDLGESAIITATGNAGSIKWTPSLGTMSCDYCRTSQVFPEYTTTYEVELTDSKGCINRDTVKIQIGGILRVPNTFTPNGDGINDTFYPVSENITSFNMQIFNRWGELLYETDNLENGWDGIYQGTLSKVDTYVWKITYGHIAKSRTEIMGHVNLVK